MRRGLAASVSLICLAQPGLALASSLQAQHDNQHVELELNKLCRRTAAPAAQEATTQAPAEQAPPQPAKAKRIAYR